MSFQITERIKKLPRAGWRKRLGKINEIIDFIVPFRNISMEEKQQDPEVLYSTNKIIIVVRDYQPQIDALEARIAALETTSADHESRITALEP
jgi:hypothetical protein